jgi:hypothetical protein
MKTLLSMVVVSAFLVTATGCGPKAGTAPAGGSTTAPAGGSTAPAGGAATTPPPATP